MKYRTFILSLLILMAGQQVYAQPMQDMQNRIQRYLDGISYWRFEYNAEDTSFGHTVYAPDSIYAYNDSLVDYLTNVAPGIPGVLKRKPMLAENADIKIIASADNKVVIYCWNSHAGEVDFYNAIALYETSEGVKPLKLASVSDAKELKKASGEFYEVLTAGGEESKNYIFLARVKMSERDMLNIMTAYRPEDNQLKAAELFSGGMASGRFITYIYDYMANYDFEKMKEVHTVHLSKNGKKLYIPDIADGQITGKWQVYNFDGSKFVYDKTE